MITGMSTLFLAAVNVGRQHGRRADSASMNHHDCQAYFLRTGDEWTPIDYGKEAKTWMKPFKKGKETGLVEIPANWYLDDLPPMMYMKKVSGFTLYIPIVI